MKFVIFVSNVHMLDSAILKTKRYTTRSANCIVQFSSVGFMSSDHNVHILTHWLIKIYAVLINDKIKPTRLIIGSSDVVTV